VPDERLIDARKHEGHDRENARTENGEHAAGKGEKYEQHNDVLSFNEFVGQVSRPGRNAYMH
jgi:hypothetical protein